MFKETPGIANLVYSEIWDFKQSKLVPFTYVSGQPITLNFKGQAAQEHNVILADGTDRLS
jgi:hypothetical protein